MDSMMAARGYARMPGTIDFRYEFQHDIVVARPRWTLETAADVSRWYEAHGRYLGARFSRPKDLITVHDSFVIAPQVGALWESYSSRLTESLVRVHAAVNTKTRLRLASGVGMVARPIEAHTLEEAIAAILARREGSRSGTALRTSSRTDLPAVEP
jgi:hypothetical protein